MLKAFWKQKGILINSDPWTESAMTWCLLCRFRKGPWTGKVTKDIRIIIGRLVFKQAPNLENTSFCFDLDNPTHNFTLHKSMKYWHDLPRRITRRCIICSRPFLINGGNFVWTIIGDPVVDFICQIHK